MSDWWAKKLGAGTPGKVGITVPPRHPAAPAAPAPNVNVPPGYRLVPVESSGPGQAPDHDPTFNEIVREGAEYVTTKAKSVDTSPCPECGGGNYFARGNAAAHCFDCGYPALQTGSGMGIPGVKASGGSQPARQIEGPGFQGHTIIGRVS